MSWSTKEKAFYVEAYFANNPYKVVQASFRRKFQWRHAPWKSRIFDWMQKFREYGTVRNLISGMLILVGRWMPGRKKTSMLYGSDFQPVFRGKLVFRERSSGVPQEIW